MRLNNMRQRIVERPLREYSGLAAREMEKTTVNFRVVSPNFQSSFDFDDAMAFVGPTNDPDGMIWFYLDQGTSVRYAIMSPGYISGTTPGTLSTSPAQGNKMVVDTSQPMPGIEPRLWTELIAEDLGPKFLREVSRNVERFIGGIFR